MNRAFQRIVLTDEGEMMRFASTTERIVADEQKESEIFNQSGPKDPRYLSILEDLSKEYLSIALYDKAMLSAIRYEQMQEGPLTEGRVANLYQIACIHVAQGHFIEAQELALRVRDATAMPTIGWWSRWWNLHFVSILAETERMKDDILEEELLHYRVADAFAREFGPETTITLEARLLLGECQERKKDYQRALYHYLAVYAHFMGKGLFSTADEAVGLLSHIYMGRKHLGEKGKLVELKSWILTKMNKANFSLQGKKKVAAYLKEC